MTTMKQREQDEARERLEQWLKPGDIGLVVFLDGEPIHPNHAAAKLLGRRLSSDYDAVVCQGAGMDMGFDLVYSLSLALFGDGYALKQRWL